MKLEKMALIAEIVGGIGIIVSLLYVGYEVARNVDRMDIAHHLALSEQITALKGSQLENDALAKVIVQGDANLSSLEPYQRSQYEAYTGGLWDIWENAHAMAKVDQLDQFTWEAWSRALCRTLDTPGSVALWKSDFDQYYMDTFVPLVNQCYEKSTSHTVISD